MRITFCFLFILQSFIILSPQETFANSTICSRFFKDAHVDSIPKAKENEGNVIFRFPHHKKRNNAISRGDTFIAYSLLSDRRVFVEWFRPMHELPWYLPSFMSKEQNFLYFRSEIAVSSFDKKIFSRILESSMEDSEKPTTFEEQLSLINDFIHDELGYGKYVKYEDLFITELTYALSPHSTRIVKLSKEKTVKPSHTLGLDFLDMVIHIAKSRTFFQKLQNSIDHLKITKEKFGVYLEEGMLNSFDQHALRINYAKDMYQGLKSSKNPRHKNLLKEVEEKFAALKFHP